jgi:hypothetical protein
LKRAEAILGEVARVILPPAGQFDLGGDKDLVEAILGIVTRHPMRESELVAALEQWSPGEVGETLQRLAESGRTQVVARNGERYWSASDAFYDLGD